MIIESKREVIIMSRENTEKIERKRFQRKLAVAIQWLEFLEYHNYDVQMDRDELKSLKDCIKFLKSLN